MLSEEQLLVQRARAGDIEAYALVYSRYYPKVLRFSAAMTDCVAAAEDIAQDVFVELPALLARFDPTRAALATYLFGIVRNLVRQRRRRDGRLRRLELAELETFRAQQPDPGAQLEGRQHAALVRSLVKTLPERLRAPLLLCDLHDVPYAVAAARLGTTPGALHHRLREGRGHLRRGLDKTLPTDRVARGNHHHGMASSLRSRVGRRGRAR